MPVLAGDHIDRVEAADDAAVLAIAGEARVDVDLVGAGVDDVAPLPGRMIPFGQCARREAFRLHVALVQDDERVRGEPHRGKLNVASNAGMSRALNAAMKSSSTFWAAAMDELDWVIRASPRRL